MLTLQRVNDTHDPCCFLPAWISHETLPALFDAVHASIQHCLLQVGSKWQGQKATAPNCGHGPPLSLSDMSSVKTTERKSGAPKAASTQCGHFAKSA